MRYLARFQVETLTPLSIGSGRSGLLNQRLVAKDANGLPHIPGTSLAGVVRHTLKTNLEEESIEAIFGFQRDKSEEGQGSRILFSSGHLLAVDGKTVLEGLQKVDFSHAYYKNFKHLPERDHVRINHRGVADKTGKFEEELVNKGTRFVFEIELEGHAVDAEIWQQILDVLNSPQFRIGAGTRKGFGQFKVCHCYTRQFDLSKEADFTAYLHKSSSLNAQDTKDWSKYTKETFEHGLFPFHRTLVARDFFLFGAGIGSSRADQMPKKEEVFEWTDQGVKLSEYYLLPATSIKGAIAHRVAYHYNRLNHTNIEQLLAKSKEKQLGFDVETALQAKDYQLPYPLEQLDYPSNSPEWQRLEAEINSWSMDDNATWQQYLQELNTNALETAQWPVGEKNNAVKTLFGSGKNSPNTNKKNNNQVDLAEKEDKGARGKVLFSDFYLAEAKVSTKVFNHVALDRFTGGARDGALFTEELSASKAEIKIKLFVEPSAFADDPLVKEAWEAALADLDSGQLQLGGSSNKGHGVFQKKMEAVNSKA